MGKILEVFIPQENKLIDSINSKKIGFKILVNNEIMEIIEEQDEINANIFKNDLVKITTQVINDKEFITLENIEGENDD